MTAILLFLAPPVGEAGVRSTFFHLFRFQPRFFAVTLTLPNILLMA